MATSMLREIMTFREVAEYLRIKPITLYKHLERGRLPAFKVGSKWRMRRVDLEKWIRERTNNAR
jgi:excisionase family DNA binding protein